MATPHKGEHAKGEKDFESWWTLLWCLWHPPSLPELFPLHFKGLAAVRGPSLTGTNPRSGRIFLRYPRARFREYAAYGTRQRDIVGGSFSGCPRRAQCFLRHADRPTMLSSPCWKVALSGLSVLCGRQFPWYSAVLGDSVVAVDLRIVSVFCLPCATVDTNMRQSLGASEDFPAVFYVKGSLRSCGLACHFTCVVRT